MESARRSYQKGLLIKPSKSNICARTHVGAAPGISCTFLRVQTGKGKSSTPHLLQGFCPPPHTHTYTPVHTHKSVKPAVAEEFKILFSVANEEELIVFVVPRFDQVTVCRGRFYAKQNVSNRSWETDSDPVGIYGFQLWFWV